VTSFLAFTVVGTVVGCIYALTATGLVVTYITSGIFNFAHGAVGMISAFTYWELTVHHGWPTPVALVFVLLVMAPALGVLIDVTLMRNLHDASEEVRIIVTVGLMLFLIGVAQTIWKPDVPRVLPQFFAGHQVSVFSVSVSYHQIIVVATAAAVALGLRLFLFRTRTGVALRAVVDAPDLAAMFGAAPARVRMLGWAMGSSLAALAGLLLAPLVTLDILLLTLLVINGYAAAIVGRLRSLPLTFAGGVVLGLLEAHAIGRLPTDLLNRIRPTLPIMFLYVALLALPQNRLRAGRVLSRSSTPATTLRTSVIGAAAFVVVAWVIAAQLSVTNLFTFGRGLVFSMIMLSLVLLTGYGGQISLCQLTFAGFGAFAMGKVAGGDSVFGLAAAVGFAGLGGILAALPAFRLRGLYLALVTFAFATAMRFLFFGNPRVFDQGGALRVGRLQLGPLHFQSHRSYVVLIAAFFAASTVVVLAIRRSTYGRQLAAMSDSQVACATLGMSLPRLKLLVFTVSAALAGLAGALFGGLQGSVGTNDFQELNSLAVLLLLAIWGVDSVIAVVAAGMSFALFPVLQSHLPEIRALPFLLTGFGAFSIGRSPGGTVREISERIVGLRDLLRSRRDQRDPDPEPTPVPATARVTARVTASGGHGGPPPALEVIGLRAGYGRIEVLHGVDLVVPPATVFALLGPNGAGKSTLLKVISGNLGSTGGCVHVAGVHVNGASPESMARLGVCTIPEGRPVFANLTVAENVRMMTYRSGIGLDSAEERAYSTFPVLGERRHQLAGTLSGGEQQMLALARAVATEPAVLLLDEISMGLAPLIVNQLYEHVGRLAEQGIAILLVEQFVNTAMSMADLVGVMSHGRIERVGEGADMVEDVSAAYLGAVR
jgi:branched-chain amino acid transport system permease protein